MHQAHYLPIVNKQTNRNWIYPIIIHNLTFINFMFDWGETVIEIL